MLVQHSSEVLIHRLSRIEGRTLEASQAEVARIRGELMARQALERQDASQSAGRARVDKSA